MQEKKVEIIAKDSDENSDALNDALNNKIDIDNKKEKKI